MRTILINGVEHQMYEAGDTDTPGPDEIVTQIGAAAIAARREALITFLLHRGLGEERRGYGHATAEDIADELIANGWIEGA
jgi:hypothetical protein